MVDSAMVMLLRLTFDSCCFEPIIKNSVLLSFVLFNLFVVSWLTGTTQSTIGHYQLYHCNSQEFLAEFCDLWCQMQHSNPVRQEEKPPVSP